MSPQDRADYERLVEEQRSLRSRLERLEGSLRDFHDRLQTPAQVDPVVPPPSEPPRPAPTPAAIPPLPVLPPVLTQDKPPVVTTPPVPPAPATPENKTPWELAFGTTWLVRIGILILLTGLVVLVRYSYQMFITGLGPSGKAALLYLGSFGLLGAGLVLERWQESLRNYGRVVAAGGFAAVYFTTFAIHRIDALRLVESPATASVLLLAWCAAVFFYAGWRQSQTTAVAAVLFSFYSTGLSTISTFALGTHVLLCILAVALMVRHGWTILSWATLVGVYGSFLYWRVWESARAVAHDWGIGTHTGTPLLLPVLFLAAYWTVFTIGSLLDRRGGPEAIARSILNNAFFFVTASLQLASWWGSHYWKVSLAYSVVLLALSFVCRFPRWVPTGLAGPSLAQGLILLIVSIVAGAGRMGIPSLLTVLGLLLILSPSVHAVRTRAVFGLVCAGGALLFALNGAPFKHNASSFTLWTLLVGAHLFKSWWVAGRPLPAGPWPVLQSSVFTGVATVSLIHVLLKLAPGDTAPAAFVSAAVVWGLACLRIRLIPWAIATQLLLVAAAVSFLQAADANGRPGWLLIAPLAWLANAAAWEQFKRRHPAGLQGTSSFALVIGVALAAAWIGITFDGVREIAATAVLSVLLHTTRRSLPGATTLVLGWLLAGWIYVLAMPIESASPGGWATLFLSLAWIMAQLHLSRSLVHEFAWPPFPRAALQVFGLVTWLFAVMHLVGYAGHPLPDPVVWTLFAGTILAIGFPLRERSYRYAGLTLLALTVGRVFIYDVWDLPVPLVVLSLFALGGAILLLGFVYSKFQDRIKPWL
jgi:uncharacterized membrane protein